jgi:hypothetical protein
MSRREIEIWIDLFTNPNLCFASQKVETMPQILTSANFIFQMGGDRPKNHIPARYVTVINRDQGSVRYFGLDSKGSLILTNGVPLLCKTEDYRPHQIAPVDPAPLDPSPVFEENTGNTWTDDPFTLGNFGDFGQSYPPNDFYMGYDAEYP